MSVFAERLSGDLLISSVKTNVENNQRVGKM